MRRKRGSRKNVMRSPFFFFDSDASEDRRRGHLECKMNVGMEESYKSNVKSFRRLYGLREVEGRISAGNSEDQV